MFVKIVKNTVVFIIFDDFFLILRDINAVFVVDCLIFDFVTLRLFFCVINVAI